ncbi:uncharacterized protein LOC124896819 [Capsicum annuum]|uniref:uncharacterized protein LOC124896819 n=1 Tax=Capsicum annuum TaxID=4072 RepID=UPI001FB0ABF7|nr:uncharacterized protein LOC124896819 [Capsicum annuum]
MELVKILRNRKINIVCVQETKWVGSRARDVDEYKLWYSSSERHRNEVGILMDEELKGQVVEVNRVSDRVMTINLVIEGFTVHVCSAYAPQGTMMCMEALVLRIGMKRDLLFWTFERAFGLVVVNSNFSKKEEHLVTFRSRITKTQIDFLLLRKGDRALCKDYKVFPNENLATQHRLLVMNLVIKMVKKRMSGEGRPRVRWGGLTLVSALEMEVKLEGMVA